MSHQRWPRWVYDDGDEPDARFTLANERTFLAWLRTSLAFLAAAIAVEALDLNLADGLARGLSIGLTILAAGSAITAWLRWAYAERAMRRHEPLPSAASGVLLSIALLAGAIAVIVTVAT